MSSVTNATGAPGALDFRQRFGNHRGVVLGEPVAEEGVGHAHPDRAVTVGDKRRRLEPGVEAVPVDLRLDTREDLVPDVAGGHLRAFRGPFALLEPCTWEAADSAAGRLPASYKGLATFAPVLFHNFFHSCGNLRGETLRSRPGRRRGEGTVP